ncbi:MAG: glycosyltransferase [Taibaiella sp.]|jgi:glycosyltransferase involved in cell wall biosynthesis
MHNKEKTLVILSPAFATDETESVIPSQELLIKMFNRLYPSLKIIVLAFHFPVKREHEYEWFGNKVITGNGAMKGGLHSLLLWIRVWNQLRRLHQTYHIIGLFSFFCSECAFVGHYFAKWHKLKHEIWVMGQDAKKGNHQVKRIKPKPEELVAISDFIQREFERNYRIKPKYVTPFGVDASLLGPMPQYRDIDIMGAGSLIPLKQFDQFVDIIGLVTRDIPEVNASISGNGPEEENINNRIRSLQLEKQVTLTGKKTHKETLAMMQRCKVFLHTSSYEGMSVACLEALCAGAQVITFCKSMNADMPGWNVVNTKEEMAAKAIELLQQKTPDYRSAVPYSLENTAKSILNLFDNM